MSTGSTASTVLFLIRHGQSESNLNGQIGGHTPSPLTDLGHRQARATAAAVLRDLQPTTVLSSDLLRARQTAEPIGQSCDLDVGFDERLRERSLGVLDGLTFEQAAERYPDHWQRLRSRDPAACPPGGETVAGVFERVSQVIDDLVRDHAGERVAIVSHGMAIYHALAHILGLGNPADGLRVFSLVDNCSISMFTFRRDHWLLGTVNDRAHLRDVT